MVERGPPAPIIIGRRSLDCVPGVSAVGSPILSTHGRWAIPFTATVPQGVHEIVPVTTRWYLLIDDDYPRGVVDVAPAKEGGLVVTLPHQRRNDVGPRENPWRTGKLCLDRPLAKLGRGGEDLTVEGRIHWHAARALEWIRAARSDRLRSPTERFELPELPELSAKPTIGYLEDAATFEGWKAAHENVGIVTFAHQDGWCRVERFEQVETGARWGSWAAPGSATSRGAWIRLPEVPTVRDWYLPRTWGEFREATRISGVELDDVLPKVVPALRVTPSPTLLVGTAIPTHWAGPAQEMHWWAMSLPALASPRRPPNGFRAKESALWLFDRQTVLADEATIDWRRTANLAPPRFRSRGSATTEMKAKHILLIGAGSLGSQMAELLVRLGARRIDVLDPEGFDPGNVARHVLTLRDVGRLKRDAVVERLRNISPTAVAEAVRWQDAQRRSKSHESYDVVVDCTADRHALDALDKIGDGQRQVDWFSVSVSVDASRLYVFHARASSFPRLAFENDVGPWVSKDQASLDPATLQTEGAGCWSVTSPARADDIAMAAALAVRTLDQRVALPTAASSEMFVFERREDAGLVQGFIRV